jgi:hypothetical protein
MSVGAEVTNQSIEKGIYLTPASKLVHACKVREDMGCGITRCGYQFLIGSPLYVPDVTFGEPAKDGMGSDYLRCPKCGSGETYKTGQWRNWKYIVRRTLKMIGHIDA